MKNFFSSVKTLFLRRLAWRKIGIGAAAAAVVLGVCVAMGWYPIAMVNGHLIFAKSFYTAYQSGSAYWGALLAKQNNGSLTPHIQNQIRGLAFESVIDDYLSTGKLQSDIGAAVLDEKIRAAENEANASTTLKDSLASAGVSDINQVQYFIRQMAIYNLLDGDVRLEGSSAIQWLSDARKRASVIVFIPGYRWTGSEMIVPEAVAAP